MTKFLRPKTAWAAPLSAVALASLALAGCKDTNTSLTHRGQNVASNDETTVPPLPYGATQTDGWAKAVLSADKKADAQAQAANAQSGSVRIGPSLEPGTSNNAPVPADHIKATAPEATGYSTPNDPAATAAASGAANVGD